jgi:hypothetical protein
MTDDWQERLRREFTELGERVEKLRAFIGSPGFFALSEVERNDLTEQETHMTRYGHVLLRRVIRADVH